MVYINLLIIILIILLAVLGRKNKSKYKAVHVPGLEKLIMRTAVMTEDKARAAADKFTADAAAICFFVIFTVNLISLVYGICGVRQREDEDNLVLRQEYDGDEITCDLVLTDREGEELYSLKVAPLEYTQEEFIKRTESVYSELAGSILGENTDLQHITTELCLSEYDSSGLIHLSWSSGQPEILSSSGQLDNLSISECVTVKLDVVMEYGEYEKSYSYDVVVEPEIKTETGFDTAKETVSRLEEEGRKNRELVIPSEVAGVHIALAEEKDYTQIKLMVLGILICFLCVCMKYFKLKEKGERMDAGLEEAYVGFVESLVLLIESGMTVKKAVSYLAIRSNVQGKLCDELKYAVNMIDTGYDEAVVYEQLGTRLALPEYVSLFNYISQNIRKGNSNLKAVLNNCAYEASRTEQERIRKRGEKTSTKLLFPMIMLLAAVMLIIIVPALISF